MSRIDDLLREHCPNGVPFRPVGQLARIATARVDPATLDASNYVGVDNLLPNFGGRRDSGYVANSTGAIKFQPGDLLIGNIRPYLRKVWLADRTGGASPDVVTLSLSPSARESALPRFLYFLIASEPFIHYTMRHAKGAKMPRGDKTATLRYRVPVPPLELQREIVRTLDQFTELQMELESNLGAELEARQRQLAHYREALLEFTHSEVRCVRLGELASFTNGKPHERVVDPDGGVTLITARFISTRGRSARYVKPVDVLSPANPDDIALVMSDLPNGRALARAFYVDADGRYAANQRVCLLHVTNPRVLSRFLYYVVDRNAQLLAFDNGLDQTHLSRGQIMSIQVPVPELADQQRVVSILDRFEALVNDLSIGLSAELAARRKQYEHYRDRLLTFEEAA